MQIAVLGPVQVHDQGGEINLGTSRQRAVVTALALGDGRTVAAETVIARVWGPNPTPGALSTLHGYIAALRRVLEPDRAPREAARVLVTDGAGYALRISRGDTDVARLEQAVSESRTLLGVVPDHFRPRAAHADREQVARGVAALDDALALWRGEPYGEVLDDPVAVAERTRLADLRMAAQELRVVGLLALGRHAEVVPVLAAMTAQHPLHERWWALHAVALARSGRQADALTALQSLRDLLADELGIDPSTQVRELHLALLRQDPSTGWDETSELPTEPASAPATGRRSRFRESPPLPRWPLVGRGPELLRLKEVLGRARAGHPQVAVVTGEAGVGKSRLALEASSAAFTDGFVVVSGQCTLDGPPPLWPWRRALTSLVQQTDCPSDVLSQIDTLPPHDFTTWETVAQAFVRAAATRPVLVLLEDVQWADPATLRLLHHLMSVARHERLCVLVTLRSEEGTDLAMTASLARHDGARIDLSGLRLSDAATLVAELAGHLAGEEVEALWLRSSGNPFYLTELALSGGQLSGTLADVVLAQVRGLPAETVTALEAASVIDVVFDLDLLAVVLGESKDGARHRLAPAIAAGLVSDGGELRADFMFAHGVVREVVHGSLSHGARARWHRQVSTALEQWSGLGRPNLRSALAHHWELAGYEWVAEAWPSVLKAASIARTSAAYDEEARLIGRALVWQRADLGSGLHDRFDLLMRMADAARWSGDWQAVSDAVDEAVDVAEQIGSPELAARAAISTMEGALWQVRPIGAVHVPIIEALERVLLRLPAEESDLRCRAMLALAMELFYGGDVARIDALVAEALGIAEATDDNRLRAIAYIGAFSARTRPDTARDREAYAAKARAAAVVADDQRSRLLAETLAVSVSSELGCADVVRRELPRLLQLTRARGLATAEAVLRTIDVPWLVMSGEDEAAATSLNRLEELAATLRMPNLVGAVQATKLATTLLAGDPTQLKALLSSYGQAEDGHADDQDADALVVVALLRAGMTDLARVVAPAALADLSPHTFLALINECLACEAAAGLGDRDLAAVAYPRALAYAGRMCSAGSAVAFGPVDAFLALGAAALGDDEAAATHAEAARALAREWQLPRVAEEMDRSRARYAF